VKVFCCTVARFVAFLWIESVATRACEFFLISFTKSDSVSGVGREASMFNSAEDDSCRVARDRADFFNISAIKGSDGSGGPVSRATG